MRFVDAVCCNGRLCGEYTRQLGVAADRITYGHMSADTEGLALALQRTEREEVARNRHRFGISGVCLLYVGKLIVPKGLRHLLAAWANIDPKLSAKASLLLVGDGPDREFLENFRAARGLSNVHFAGAIDYDSLALYYASADAFVIPTLEDNWSLVVPEAMSCGLPILCSKYNGCWPELVHEGDNGWLFDPLQPADTVRCLEECLRNASNLPTMGDKSLLILNEHTPQRAARAVFEACQLAMAACHPRRSEAFTDDER
jgi:glycosyltransferase involved in cell wall biosynthesis